MGYEFDYVNLEMIIKDKENFQEMVNELEQDKGTSWMPEELYIEDEGYCPTVYEDDFDQTKYPNFSYLKINHNGLFKWWDIKRWLNIFNKYCLGEMDFHGEFGEYVIVEFTGKDDYVIKVSERRRIPECDWNEGFKEHFYPDEEEVV
jgi:hypothetical protein